MSLEEWDPSVLEQGDLARRGLVELLGLAFARRVTGELRLKRRRQTTEIWFQRGLPTFARTTGGQLGILEVMTRERRLTPEDVLQVRQFARDRRLDEAECLKVLFEVSDGQLDYFRSSMVKEIIVSACGYREGEYRFTKMNELPAAQPVHDFNPLELIYLGLVKYRSPDLFRELHALSKRKVMPNPEVRDFFLLPDRLYEHSDVLDRFEGEPRVDRAIEFLQSELGDMELALIALRLFLVTRLVVLKQGREQPAAERAKVAWLPVEEESARRPEPEDTPATDYIITRPRRTGRAQGGNGETKVMTERAPSRGQKERVEFSAPEPEPPPVEPKPEQAPDEEREALRRRLREWDERARLALSFYDRLQVTVEDDATEVQQTWLDFSRDLEPARLPAGDDEITRLASGLRELLEEAALTLAEAQRRLAYERDLARVEIERAYKLPMRQVLAKKMVARGQWYLRHHHNAGAREFFEKAIELDAREAEPYMHLGWTMFRDPDGDPIEARGYLLSALEIDEGLARANYYLGLMAKQSGDEGEAETRFRRAAELDPGDRSSRRELAFLMQKQKQTGLWYKLFGGD